MCDHRLECTHEVATKTTRQPREICKQLFGRNHSCVSSPPSPTASAAVKPPLSAGIRAQSHRGQRQKQKHKKKKKPVALTFCSLSPQHTPVTMDQCVGDLHSDHHGDGSLPPKAPRRGGVRRVGGRLGGGKGEVMEQVTIRALIKMQQR